MAPKRFKQNKNITIPDKEIVQQILEGDDSLFEVLYTRYSAKIYHKCLEVTRDKNLSKDLAHDILIKVFMKLDKFRGTSDFSFWVYAITYNHCMDHVKKFKKQKFGAYQDINTEIISTEEIELEHKILQDLKLEQLEIILENLVPEEKVILFMRYQDELSISQISSTLKISPSAVKMRLKRSRDKLAAQLKKITDEPA